MSDLRHVFISHATANKAFADRLANLVTERGATVFRDGDVSIGDLWPEVVRREIERAAAFILVIPPDEGSDRNNVWFEAGAARALGKRVLAVLPPGSRPTELPNDIADVLVLDADMRPLESIADTLVQAVPTVEGMPS